jgi:hypothetical protein
LVEVNQRIPNRDEAKLRPRAHGREPSAASRVFDERPASRGALDPAPGSQAWRCLKKTLDTSDDVIHGTWSGRLVRFVVISELSTIYKK